MMRSAVCSCYHHLSAHRNQVAKRLFAIAYVCMCRVCLYTQFANTTSDTTTTATSNEQHYLSRSAVRLDHLANLLCAISVVVVVVRANGIESYPKQAAVAFHPFASQANRTPTGCRATTTTTTSRNNHIRQLERFCSRPNKHTLASSCAISSNIKQQQPECVAIDQPSVAAE